ncbi:hypothetical protein [Streptomyces lunaelactis]|uniref:hypothetical protein n=1 Tax=Streptomyces lunaelactis TaxID=1535768 RepID=UPI0020C7B4CA|nr:hypothetical protein [Streptomyces lunaelactis]
MKHGPELPAPALRRIDPHRDGDIGGQRRLDLLGPLPQPGTGRTSRQAYGTAPTASGTAGVRTRVSATASQNRRASTSGSLIRSGAGPGSGRQ